MFTSPKKLAMWGRASDHVMKEKVQSQERRFISIMGVQRGHKGAALETGTGALTELSIYFSESCLGKYLRPNVLGVQLHTTHRRSADKK